MKDILEAKRRRQLELIAAIRAASPEELKATAEQIKAVMRASKSSGRQCLTPPASHLTESILSTAQAQPEGSLLSPRNFLHLGSRTAIHKALSKLAQEGQLLRVSRGVYVAPVLGRFGPRPPSTQALLQALKIAYGETVVASGAAEANVLGLTTQVPVREVFLTSGASRTMQLGNRFVELRHGDCWQLLLGKRPAGSVIRALSWLGPESAPEALKRLRPRLPESEWEALCGARAMLPSWMAKLISEAIAKEKSGSMEARRPRDLNLHKSKPETN